AASESGEPTEGVLPRHPLRSARGPQEAARFGARVPHRRRGRGLPHESGDCGPARRSDQSVTRGLEPQKIPTHSAPGRAWLGARNSTPRRTPQRRSNSRPWSDSSLIEIELLVATFLFCSLLKIERQIRQKAAGYRTHVLVGLGSCTFTLIPAQGCCGRPSPSRPRPVSPAPSRTAAHGRPRTSSWPAARA